MTKQPKIGDTFIIRGIITHVDSVFFRYSQDHNQGQSCLMPLDRISEVIPKPWEPKVGDQIRYNTGGAFIYTIQAIIQDRIWVDWVASNGIRSDSIIHDFKKENYTLCVD